MQSVVYETILAYTILDIGALNSFIVLKKDLQEPEMKRRAFLKQLAFSLCKDYAQYRLMHKNIPKQLKTRICRCCICDWKKNRPSKTRCSECKFFVCPEHSSLLCVGCFNAEAEMQYSIESS